MNDALLVRVLDGLTDLCEKFQPFFGGKIVLVAVVRDLAATHQFHDEVRPARVCRTGIEHFGNVGMIHERQGLALSLEAGDHLIRVHAQLDDFKGHPSAHWLLLLGHEYYAASAFADLLKQFVASDAVAGFFGGRAGDALGCARDLGPDRRGLRSGCLSFQECDCLFMNSEQRLEVEAQVVIIGTGSIQIGTTFAGVQFQGRAKEGHFAIGRGVHGLLKALRYNECNAPQTFREGTGENGAVPCLRLNACTPGALTRRPTCTTQGYGIIVAR